MMTTKQREMSARKEIIPGMTRLDGGERLLSASAPIFDASIAESGLVRAVTGDGGIATMPASNGPQESASVTADTPATTKRIATVTECEHCGREFIPRRPHGRFCGAYCRRLAWLDRNPEKAAELAERDKARLRAHVLQCGGVWVDRSLVSGT